MHLLPGVIVSLERRPLLPGVRVSVDWSSLLPGVMASFLLPWVKVGVFKSGRMLGFWPRVPMFNFLMETT